MIDEWMGGWMGGELGDEEEKAPPGHRSECPEKDAPIARGLELETFGLRDRQLELSWSKATPLFLHTVYGCFHSVPELSSMT